jgi:hypothetical protein
MALFAKPCSIMFVALTLFAHTLCAQRLHDTRKAQLTRDAAKNFDDLASKNNSLYELAFKNVDVVHSTDLSILRQRNKATLDADLAALPTLTWKEMLDRVAKKRQDLVSHLPTPATGTSSSAESKKEALAQEIRKLQDQIAAEDSAARTALPTVKQIHAFISTTI